MDDKLYGTSPVKKIFCAGDEAILLDVEKSEADRFLRKSSPRLLDWVFLFLFRDQHRRQQQLITREYNVTLLGYVRSHSGYVYSGENRLI
jgi:hypothetical protein